MNCHQQMSKPAEWKNEDARAFIDSLIERVVVVLVIVRV